VGTADTIERRNPPSQLRLARLTLGWRQADLAQRAGLSREAIVHLELGKAAPQLATAMALARALERPVEELFPVEDVSDQDAA
jgi:putative transcriptional regulator